MSTGTNDVLAGEVGPKYVSRELALGRLGLARNDDTLFEFFDDFPLSPGVTGLAAAGAQLAGWDISSRAGSGAIVGNTGGVGGGVLDVKTGATANSKQDMLGTVSLISNVTTKKWYMRMRFAPGSTPDAQAVLFFGLINRGSSVSIGIGINGALDITHFAVQYDGILAGTSQSLGVTKDTANHIGEMWGIGSTALHVTIDGGADLGPFAMASAPSDACSLFITARNGTAAANQDILPDWLYILCQR